MNDMTQARLTFYIPFDIPNKNGSVLTKEAIKSIVEACPAHLPVVYQDGKGDYSETEVSYNEMVVGITNSSPCIVNVDAENQLYQFAVDCTMFEMGIEVLSNLHKDKTSDMKITGVGLLCKDRDSYGLYQIKCYS